MLMQDWQKRGLIYDGCGVKGFSYASVPFGRLISENVIRIYFSSRDVFNRSFPFFLDYDLKINKIIYISPESLLNIGDSGCFDDSGIMPTCLVALNNKELWMYYIGWNLGVTVPFRNSIGLAVSIDNGKSFTRLYNGPIIDRTKSEPHFNASACVIRENGIWKIWYLSCTKWVKSKIGFRHYYHIKYAESIDGINWDRQGIVAIDFRFANEYAISVPRVIKENDLYKMWFSYRGGEISETYRIGYAESVDGKLWQRRDELVSLDVSPDGWDSDMVCYPFIFDYMDDRYMLYNGNDYGKSGFGIAKLNK